MVDRLVEKCCENYNVHAENQWKSMVAEMFEGPTFFFLELQKSKNNKKNRADISSVFFFAFSGSEDLVSHKISSKANDACMHRQKKGRGCLDLW